MRIRSSTITIVFLAAAIFLALSPLSAATQTTVYQNDFTGGPDTGFAPGVSGWWSVAPISHTPTGRYGRFLGEFGSQTVSLTLNSLPSHDEVTVSFLLLILKSWDGTDSTWGPDIWSLNVGGGPTLLKTTFSNVLDFGPGGETFPQSFPGGYPGINFRPGTGSMETNTLGYQFGGAPMDSVYALSYTFRHTGSSLTLNFVGQTTQGAEDESWGLDNVEVKLRSTTPSGGVTPPELGLTTSLVRTGGDLLVAGTATNVGGSTAAFTLQSATLVAFDPTVFYGSSDPLPIPLGVLAPGEHRSFSLRFLGSIGPPGRWAALALTGIAEWEGTADVNGTLIFTRDFNSLKLP
jgi:hypothetical protein